MQIDYVEIENYRQYKEEKIDFSLGTADKKGVTVIKGDNGAGKSNLLNAITWCLYEQELHIDEEDNEGLPVPSTIALAEAEEGDKCEVRVEVEMKDESGNRHNFERVKVFRKSGANSVQEIEGPGGFTYEKEVNNDMKIQSDPEYIRDRSLPEGIMEYFFFDGEQLNKYFKSSSGQKIKGAVFDVSQIQVLENALFHLRKRKKEYLDKADELSPEVEEIRDNLNEIEENLEEAEEAYDEKVKERDELRKKKEDLKEKLEGHPDAQKLEKEKQSLEDQREKFEDKLETAEERKRKELIEDGPYILAGDAIKTAIENIKEKKEKGAIPPKYRKEFIEDLLDSKDCICGRGLEKGSDHREDVKEYLEKASDLNDLEEQLIEGHATLKNKLSEVLRSFEEDQNQYNTHIEDWKDQLKKTNEEIEDIESQLRNADKDEIKRMQRELDQVESELNNVNEEVAEKKIQKEKLEGDLKDEEIELDEELNKEDKYADINNINEFCKEAESVGKEIKEEIMSKVREDIEEKTEKWFFELLWKNETYQSVDIDEDYNISVEDQGGWSALGTLSKGETQSLALSFMTSVNNVSGFNAPLVIDTPLGRIDPSIKRSISAKIPEMMKDRQLTLLVTGSEYTQEVKEELRDHVGEEYEVEFKEHSSGSEAKVI